jgi:hypothetical protein
MYYTHILNKRIFLQTDLFQLIESQAVSGGRWSSCDVTFKCQVWDGTDFFWPYVR